jgi:hypothetical protein
MVCLAGADMLERCEVKCQPVTAECGPLEAIVLTWHRYIATVRSIVSGVWGWLRARVHRGLVGMAFRPQRRRI